MRGGGIAAAVDAAGRGKARILHAERRRLPVHQRRKVLRAAGQMAGDGEGRVVGGDQHQPVEQVAHRQRLAAHEAHARIAPAQPGRLVRHGDGGAEVAGHLDRQDAGHDLCGARRDDGRVRIFCIERRLRVARVDEDAAAREHRPLQVLIRKRRLRRLAGRFLPPRRRAQPAGRSTAAARPAMRRAALSGVFSAPSQFLRYDPCAPRGRLSFADIITAAPPGGNKKARPGHPPRPRPERLAVTDQ